MRFQGVLEALYSGDRRDTVLKASDRPAAQLGYCTLTLPTSPVQEGVASWGPLSVSSTLARLPSPLYRTGHPAKSSPPPPRATRSHDTSCIAFSNTTTLFSVSAFWCTELEAIVGTTSCDKKDKGKLWQAGDSQWCRAWPRYEAQGGDHIGCIGLQLALLVTIFGFWLCPCCKLFP